MTADLKKQVWSGFLGRYAILVLTLAAWVTGPANAQEMRLHLRDGSAVCGALLGEDATSTTMRTLNGPVTVRRDQVTRRQNEACSLLPAASPVAPVSAPVVQDAARTFVPLRFFGADALAGRLVPDLVDAYVASIGMRPRGWAPGEHAQQRIQEARGANSNLRITIDVANSGPAFSALAERRTDIGLASRSASAAEIAAIRTGLALAPNAALREIVIALDGLAIIVHAANPVHTLTIEQVRNVYAGQITNWSELGGPNRPIQVFAREAASDTTQFFAEKTMARRPIARTVERVDSHEAMSNAVAASADGIGFASFPYVGRNRALNLVASCNIEHEASELGIRTEDYPLSRRLYFYTGASGTPAVDDFLKVATSPAMYDAVRDANYTSMQSTLGSREHTMFRLLDAARAAPVTPEPRYAEAMLEYSLATRNALRLSSTYRFQSGSSQLDARSQDDLERTAAFLRAPENQRYKVRLLGFSDANGAFGANLAISLRRANEVAAQLRQRGVQIAQARGLSSVARCLRRRRRCSDAQP